MTQAVIAKISATPRIIRLEPLHAVGDRVPRLLDDSLPYAPTIELNRHAVRSIGRALVPILDPDMAWPIKSSC